MPKEITMSSGHIILIDTGDYEWAMQWKWCLDKDGYPHRQQRPGGKRTRHLMHKELLGLGTDVSVDHKNGNRLDVRRANLRVATKSQNGCNRGVPANNSSGYKGVSFNKGRGKWEAYVNINKQRTRLGYFMDLRQAVIAYNTKALELHGEFAYLNEVPV